MPDRKIASLVDGRQDVPEAGEHYSAASKNIKEVADTNVSDIAQNSWAVNVKTLRDYVQALLTQPVEFKGVWNANTNTPALTSGGGESGDLWIVGESGSTNLDGETNWNAGDTLLFDGSAYQKIADEGGGSSKKIQYFDLNSSDIANKFIVLDAIPSDPKNVTLRVLGGDVQVNKKALGPESGAITGNFEMDAITQERLYFGDVSATGTNEAHSFGETAFTASQNIVVEYEV